jgi:hypothetical protein
MIPRGELRWWRVGTTGSRSGAPPSSRLARRRRGVRGCHTLNRVNTVWLKQNKDDEEYAEGCNRQYGPSFYIQRMDKLVDLRSEVIQRSISSWIIFVSIYNWFSVICYCSSFLVRPLTVSTMVHDQDKRFRFFGRRGFGGSMKLWYLWIPSWINDYSSTELWESGIPFYLQQTWAGPGPVLSICHTTGRLQSGLY